MLEIGQKLLYGHLLLFICSFFYMAWWKSSFQSQAAVSRLESGSLLFLTMLTGLASITFLLLGVLFPEKGNSLPFLPLILGGGVMLYLLALYVSSQKYGRPATSELLFIVLWLVLELSSLVVLSQDVLSLNMTLAGILITIVIFLINMVCYMEYYKLNESQKFIVGMVPLGLAGVAALMVSILILSKNI